MLLVSTALRWSLDMWLKVSASTQATQKIASAFGGGMWAGQTCGCVTGALMAIGYKFGHSEDGDVKTKRKHVREEVCV